MGDPPLVVLLDGVEDPHNLGAILRTCECAGVDGVFIPEHRAAGLNETVAKTSAGAVEYVRVARVTNLVPLIDELKDRGLWVVGVEGGTGNLYSDFDLERSAGGRVGQRGQRRPPAGQGKVRRDCFNPDARKDQFAERERGRRGRVV